MRVASQPEFGGSPSQPHTAAATDQSIESSADIKKEIGTVEKESDIQKESNDERKEGSLPPQALTAPPQEATVEMKGSEGTPVGNPESPQASTQPPIEPSVSDDEGVAE